MKKKLMVMMCSLLLAASTLGFAQNKKQPHPSLSAYEHANENAKFKRDGNVFNNKTHKEIRVKRLAEKEAKKAIKKVAEAQDKGEGRVKVKF